MLLFRFIEKSESRPVDLEFQGPPMDATVDRDY